MDEELLLMIPDLAPRETQPKAEARIFCPSEFVNKAPGLMVINLSRNDWLLLRTVSGVTTMLGGRLVFQGL